MSDVGTTQTSHVRLLDSAMVSELRQSFRGEVIEPGDASYDATRAVFNSMFDRMPAAILRPTGVADVIRAIGIARVAQVPFAIRSGGHSVAGFSSCADGLVIDMRGMTGVQVDPVRKTARVQAGVDWAQLDRETQQFALAVTGGRVTTTGVVGFTIGSGSGWLERKFGFAADNLVSADVVTAEGELVHATEDDNADLLWALTGGGGNFGVVTELEFRLHPLQPIVFGGLMAFDPAQGRDVISTWRDISAEAPDDLGWAVGSVVAPPEPFVPERWRLQRMWAVVGQFAGALEEAERLIAPLRALGPEVDLFQPMPYAVVQGLIDGANPYGRRNYWRAHNLQDFDEQAIDTALELADGIPSPYTALLFTNLGGAVARVSDNATALGGRSAPFTMHLNGMWEGDEHDADNIAWTRGATERMSPWISPGMALNFYTEVDDAAIADSYGARLERLRRVKRDYDPENVFRLNQNITPA